jgi:hypothetical protein
MGRDYRGEFRQRGEAYPGSPEWQENIARVMAEYWGMLGETGRSAFLAETGLWERLKPEPETPASQEMSENAKAEFMNQLGIHPDTDYPEPAECALRH